MCFFRTVLNISLINKRNSNWPIWSLWNLYFYLHYFHSFDPWTTNYFLSDRNEATRVMIFPRKPRFCNYFFRFRSDWSNFSNAFESQWRKHNPFLRFKNISYQFCNWCDSVRKTKSELFKREKLMLKRNSTIFVFKNFSTTLLRDDSRLIGGKFEGFLKFSS